MASAPTSDPVLTRLRRELDLIYGHRIDRVVLFGSRARGDFHPDSDFDIAIFLRGMTDRWAELHRLADLRVKLIDDTGAFFDLLPYPSGADKEHSPLMRELRLEGVDI